jgi:two-component system response regulator
MVNMETKYRTIAVAEDDRDDRELTRDAFGEVGSRNPITFFNDGAELLDYLNECAGNGTNGAKLPAMILLDLNMPRVDGRQVLRHIRADVRLRHLPVIVMSTSRSDHDVKDSYSAGANSFITKPAKFQGLVDALRSLDGFWFNVASLPK